MKKLAAALAAVVIVFLARFAMRTVPDVVLRWKLSFLAWLLGRVEAGRPLAAQLREAAFLFADPASARLARRFVLEARPSQFRAVLRGALY